MIFASHEGDFMNDIKCLKNIEFVQVNYNNNIHYGGNQSWLDDGKLRDYGCGVIAMCNVELYISRCNERTSLEKNITNKNTDISLHNSILYEDYITYVNKRCQENYALLKGKLFGKLGLVPWRMKKGIKSFWSDFCNNSANNSQNIYLMNSKAKFKTKWAPTMSKSKIIGMIENMLDNDLPIVASYFTFNKNKVLDFYEFDSANHNVKKNGSIAGHYFNITGIVKLEDTNDRYFVVSSWGKMYYIKIEEWLKKISYFTNVLYINC